jgi:hypothetical protein
MPLSWESYYASEERAAIGRCLDAAAQRFAKRHNLEAETGLRGWAAVDFALSHTFGESMAEAERRRHLAPLWRRIERRITDR